MQENLYEIIIRNGNNDSAKIYDAKTFEEAGKKAESDGFEVKGIKIIPQIKSNIRIFR